MTDLTSSKCEARLLARNIAFVREEVKNLSLNRICIIKSRIVPHSPLAAVHDHLLAETIVYRSVLYGKDKNKAFIFVKFGVPSPVTGSQLKICQY